MDGSTIVDIAFAYIQSEAMIASFDLGLFEVLLQSSKTHTQIAQALNVPDIHVADLCDLLVTMGLLDKTPKAEYAINDVSRKHMLNDSKIKDAVYLGDWLPFLKMSFNADITQAVRTGTHNFQGKNKDVFVKFEKKEDMRKVFQAGMASVAKTATFLTTAFDLSSFKTYVDLGGGTGTYARAMKETYPSMNVTLCDLPRVIETAKSLPVNKSAKLNYVPADFLKDDLPKADLYSTNHVLHDWNDESCHIILTAIHKALNPGGALVVLDSIFNDDKVGPGKVNLTEMGQIAHHEGKHRTRADFTRIMEKAGFGNVQKYSYKGFGFYDGLMGTKM